MSDGLKNRVGNQKYLLVLRSVKHDGTPHLQVGPGSQENHFELYGFLPDDVTGIPTPPLMDPTSVSFHLEGVFAKSIPYNMKVRPTFIDSPKGNGKTGRKAVWSPSPQGGLIMSAALPPLYAGDRVRVFGNSRWTWTKKRGHGPEPRTKTAHPIVLGLLFSLQWIPLRKADRAYVVTDHDPTIGLQEAPRQEHGMSLAKNTPWAKKLKKTTSGASAQARPKPPTIPSASDDEETLQRTEDGTPIIPKRKPLPPEAENVDWAAEYRKK